MMNRPSRFEKKFGKYAIKNLTLLLIIGYAIGYVIQFMDSGFLSYLSLDPYKILHGQVWRIFTWMLIPPSDTNIVFVLLILWCCYSIGYFLESTWGTYKYNVFIFGGAGITVLFSFLNLGVHYLIYGQEGVAVIELLYSSWWFYFSTYYINMSIYILYAMTYPESVVRVYFILPVKMKWLGFLDAGYLIYLLVRGLINGSYFICFAVGAAIVNILIFYFTNVRQLHRSFSNLRRKSQFKRGYESGYKGQWQRTNSGLDGEEVKMKNPKSITRHKCAVCGQTEVSNPELDFRFCSKCNGNYEYCSNHLFTHTHVR